MYESHFGLSSPPFAESVDPAVFLTLPSHESALLRIRYGLEHGRGPVLVFGPSGSGKTLLARVLARQLAWPCVHLAFPAMPAADLLAYLADELGYAPASGPGVGAAVRRLRDGLSAATARGQRPLLIVDEAHLIDDPTTLETLRLLLNFSSGGPPDLALVLVGAAELLLHLPPALADRLTARSLLGPLTEEESSAYVSGRMSAVRASEPLFPPEALSALHRAADGLPRRLNRLADLALLIAYAQDRARPEVATIRIAAREAGYEQFAA